jgi:5-methylcytosine-specific restriction protein A
MIIVDLVTAIDQQQLLESARDFAERALNAYLEEDTRVILAHAAFSLEHLCKAYLYGVHPALLVELQNGQLDSLLHLVGHGDKARKMRFPRTISGREALICVEQMLPNLDVPREKLAQLIDVRDGMVHVGSMSSTGIDDLLAAFLQVSNKLHDELSSTQEDRWGEHAELVQALLSRAQGKVEQETHRQIVLARARYARANEISVSDLLSDVAERAAEAKASSDIRKFPILALARTALWELQGYTGAVPAAHGEPIGWLEAQSPYCGLAGWVYELVAADESVRAEAVLALGKRFFGGEVPEALLEDVGLRPTRGVLAGRSGGGPSLLEEYLRLCMIVEAAEARGDHDRTSTTRREQPTRSSTAVKAVLIRSAGRCENPRCTGQPNDVNKNGDPLLEVDHVHDRARWGRDHPIQMIALCPNCHAVKTRGRSGEQLRALLLSEARMRHHAWTARR